MRTLLFYLSMTLCGCTHNTKEIASGSYGPFAIGETKLATLNKIEKITSILAIEPATSNKVHLEDPNPNSIHAIDANDGILVWLDHHPWPLRVELKNDVIVNKWGMSEKCQASQARMNFACSEVKRLADRINVGGSRAEAYKVILSFDTTLSKSVGNFVVGLQEFRVGQSTSVQAYRELLLSNNTWQFEGLRELSKYKNPFYSTVTLHFQDGRLSKIKHWSAPDEML